MRLFILSVIFLVQRCSGQAEVELTLSSKGLNFAAGVAVDLLYKDILTQTIPDITGNPTISKIRVTEFVKPQSSVQLNSGVGVTVALNGVSVKAEANWSWSKKILFFTVRDSGSVTASSKASISMSVRVGSNNGKPTINAYSCSASLPDLNIKIGGSIISLVYNILISLFKGTIRSKLEGIICDAAIRTINVNGVKELATLNLTARVNQYLNVNYSLTKNPYFSSTFFKSYHNGTFAGDGVVYQTPVMNTPTDKMIGFSISENVFNSAINVLYKKGLAKYSFPFNDWNNIAQYFPFIPNTSSGPFEVIVNANAIPSVKITTTGITINLSGIVQLISKPPGQNQQTVLSITFLTSAKAFASISANVLKGYINNITSTIVGITPAINNINNTVLTNTINMFTNLIIPGINDETNKGIPLPNVQGVTFIQTSLVLNNRHISASADVRYLP